MKFIDYIHLLYLKNVSAILYYFLSLTFSRNFPNTLLIDNFIKSDSKSFRALFLISVIFYTYILKKSDYLYYMTLWIFLHINPYFKYIYRFLMLVTYFSLSLWVKHSLGILFITILSGANGKFICADYCLISSGYYKSHWIT